MQCIILMVVSFVIIFVHFCIGFRNIKRLENVCSEVVVASIIAAEKHKFFNCNYYGLLLEYSYDGKKYNTKKALFREMGNIKEIKLHINPINPNDCYLIPIRERCKCKAGV